MMLRTLFKLKHGGAAGLWSERPRVFDLTLSAWLLGVGVRTGRRGTARVSLLLRVYGAGGQTAQGTWLRRDILVLRSCCSFRPNTNSRLEVSQHAGTHTDLQLVYFVSLFFDIKEHCRPCQKREALNDGSLMCLFKLARRSSVCGSSVFSACTSARRANWLNIDIHFNNVVLDDFRH